MPIFLDKFEEESFIVFSDLTPLSLRKNQLVPFEGDGHVSFSKKINPQIECKDEKEINFLIKLPSDHPGPGPSV